MNIGISKYSQTRPLYSAINLEFVSQIYKKHKQFFPGQILNNDLNRKLFMEIKKMLIITSRNDSSFDRQLRTLEQKISVE
ncbi:hypothetical protein BpHYR1_009226, partial [Brachionus plicatilis]